MPEDSPVSRSKPSWLTTPLPTGEAAARLRRILDSAGVRTVCRASGCPNTGDCFSHGVATLLILGPYCTRHCRFCNIGSGLPQPPGLTEPTRIADTVSKLGLRYTVITSVTRDDLSDGGAGHFAATIRTIRAVAPGTRIEVLIPDFGGSEKSLRTVMDAAPDVVSHNLDTVTRLYQSIKPDGDYSRSLALFAAIRRMSPSTPLKSGLMLGMGETTGEIGDTLGDLFAAGCRILTLGQYLSPSPSHTSVERYVTPDEFDRLRDIALEMGFTSAKCGPLVRSSYRAGE